MDSERYGDYLLTVLPALARGASTDQSHEVGMKVKSKHNPPATNNPHENIG
jgi:hypothetical protein